MEPASLKPPTDPDHAEPARRPTHASRATGPNAAHSSPRWSRTTVNYWVDASLLILFMLLWFTNLVLRFVFPPSVYSEGWLLWGLDQAQWMGLQFGVLVAFTLGILLHLMLHWTWVCSVTIKLFSRSTEKGKKLELPDDGLRTIYGVILLIVVLHVVGFAALAARLMVQSAVVAPRV